RAQRFMALVAGSEPDRFDGLDPERLDDGREVWVWSGHLMSVAVLGAVASPDERADPPQLLLDALETGGVAHAHLTCSLEVGAWHYAHMRLLEQLHGRDVLVGVDAGRVGHDVEGTLRHGCR